MEIEATGLIESEPVAESTYVEEMIEESSPRTKTIMATRSVALMPRTIEPPPPRTVPSVSLEWPLIAPAGNRSQAYLLAKRAIDLAGALVLLALLSPLLVVVLVVLAITTKGHPIFCQQRLGFCGRPFRMFKFRTMVLNALELQCGVTNEQQGPVFKNTADPRVTWLGRYLRSFSIDEMPQLINVIRGDMSLVGPRPPLAAEVAKYEAWQLKRLAVKPGLTCLWQVSGRSNIDFDRWVKMDLWYLDNQSVATDINLLLRTPWCVITRRGAC